MKRVSSLSEVPSRGESARDVSPRDKDHQDELLTAFAGDFPLDDLDDADLDRVYSEALAAGLLTEEAMDRSFEELLGREVRSEPRTGTLTLAPRDLPTVGQQVRAYRARRNLSVEQLAREAGLSTEGVVRVEACTTPFDETGSHASLNALANGLQLPAARLRMLLQKVRVTLELATTQGTMLQAARKAPPR